MKFIDYLTGMMLIGWLLVGCSIWASDISYAGQLFFTGLYLFFSSIFAYEAWELGKKKKG